MLRTTPAFVAPLQSQGMGSGRSVGDVDADLEALETDRLQLEHRREAATRKQERLRWAHGRSLLRCSPK